MAPTEILARQHFETLGPPLEAQGVRRRPADRPRQGRGAGREAGRRWRRARPRSPSAPTPCSRTTSRFDDLALAVIDEQHRFGVNERQRLQDKGEAVHLLAMSATPIPRTLELTLYGDLDVSRLDEKPPGRTPVATRAVPTARARRGGRAAAAGGCDGGAQAFWICPLVAESEACDLAAAEARAADLRRGARARASAWSTARCRRPRRTR